VSDNKAARFQLVRGASYRFLGDLYHIRNVMDDDGDQIVIVRTWSRKRQMWRYSCEYADLILALVSDGTFRHQRTPVLEKY